MTYIELTDTTGRLWVGDEGLGSATADEMAALHDVLSDFKKLNYLSLEISGAKTYFNPAHIIAVAVRDSA